jgi:hypothetical protein
MILPIVAVVAALVIAYVLWTQRDGARPIAETAKREAARSADTSAQNDDAATTDAGRAVDRADTAVDVARASTTGAVGATSAAVLDSAFYRDPAGAALRYAGPVRVSGVIATMVTPGDTPALSLEGRSRFNYMIVNFPRGYRERLALLSKGQFIGVTCASAQSLGGTTILNGCLLE